jgi:hypothetical protein
MTPRAATCALIAVALLFNAGSPSPRAAGEAAVEKKNVTLTLKIGDKTSGLLLEAKKSVAKDSSAFDAIRHTIAMAYKTEPNLGPVVTSVCGVAPQKGYTWVCTVDGKLCESLGNLTLKADTKIEFLLQEK